MRKTILLFAIFILAFWASCTNHYEKEFYGTYTVNDTVNILFSKITFYPQNTYSFRWSSCLNSNRDSGSFVLDKDTIYFTSCNKERDKSDAEKHRHYNKTLTGEKLIYQRDKIAYIHNRPNDSIVNDTIYWKKDAVKK